MRARDNPFRSERVDALAYRAPDFSWAEFERRLAAAGGRGAIVGPPGHGKTTLLDGFAARLLARGEAVLRLRLALHQSRLALPDVADRWLLVDGAEQLSWGGWREVCRTARPARGFVVTSHRSGRLRTVHRCRTTPELVSELIGELTGGKPADAARLWRQHRGDVREVFRARFLAAAREASPT